jgi:hypothetical protein
MRRWRKRRRPRGHWRPKLRNARNSHRLYASRGSRLRRSRLLTDLPGQDAAEVSDPAEARIDRDGRTLSRVGCSSTSANSRRMTGSTGIPAVPGHATGRGVDRGGGLQPSLGSVAVSPGRPARRRLRPSFDRRARSGSSRRVRPRHHCRLSGTSPPPTRS